MEYAMTPVTVPEGEVVAHYAGFWIRTLAVIIDSMILGFLSIPLYPIFGIKLSIKTILSFLNSSDDPASNYLWIAFIQGLVRWLYFAIMESAKPQATVGKIALGLQVTDDDGYRISFLRATGRHFAKMLSAITLGIGFMMAGWSKNKRALHDKIAGTVVIRTR